MKIHCLFEQSGTFKKEFIKLGYEAYDYDIQNEFGETDFEVDLFEEIRAGYEGRPSIFDNITNEDLIMAFFPCTRFEDQVMLSFRGENCGMQKRWNTIQKLENSMRLHDELNEFYKLISMLVIVAEKRNLRMVIENPYSAQHYLKQYWCIKPSIVDKDRTLRGDF